MRLVFFTACAVLAALPASAQIRVAIGEEVVFAAQPGAKQATNRELAKPNAFEKFVGAEFARGQFDHAAGPSGVAMPDELKRPASPRPEPGKVRVRFTPVAPKGQSLLVIENGYDQGLVYRAKIGARDQSAPTDVCLVIPGKVGVEHWPFEIEWIELSDFRLVPWKPGDPTPCA